MSPDDARALDVGRAVLALVALLAAPRAGGDEYLSEPEAEAFTRKSRRRLADARRRGELPSRGGQRSRTYLRSELVAWLEGTKSKPVIGVVDADLEARIVRLARAR